MLKATHVFSIRHCIFIIFVLSGVNTTAEPTLRDYGSLPTTSMVAISPNGEKIAFRRTENGVNILAVTSIKENKVLAKLDVSKFRPHQLKFLNNVIPTIKSGHP